MVLIIRDFMITAIYSLGQVHGAELWLLFWLVCVIVYVGVCLSMRTNRSKQGVKTMLIGLLIAEVFVDLIWAIIYYNNGSYINYGIGAVYGLFIWIPLLLITVVIVTIKNKKSM